MRERSAEATLELARKWAETAGITEVTDITHLDRLGVPTFVSARPRALADVYTFGKGMRRVDAEVAATMEAIEYAFAEPGSAGVATFWGTPRDVTCSAPARQAPSILDFAPRLQRTASLDAPLLLALARDVETGAECPIPAELVYYPAPDVGQPLFGASTNGLASGNSVLEATYYALREVIERDIWSFEVVRRASVLVDRASLPEEACAVVERAERAGLELVVRAVPNDYGLPFFVAFLFDPLQPSRRFFNGGWGCDLEPSAALLGAIFEAAQSRLAFLHGGRRVPGVPPSASSGEGEAAWVQRHMQGVRSARGATSFERVPEAIDGAQAGQEDSLNGRLDVLIGRLRRVVSSPICRCVLTRDGASLHVVRLVIPLLESFKEGRVRVGPRLKAAVDERVGRARTAALPQGAVARGPGDRMETVGA